MRHYSDKISMFYNPHQVLITNIERSSSKSPLKPKLLLQYLKDQELIRYFDIISGFNPFEKEDFYIAHTKRYVEDVFEGGPKANSNCLPWSKDLSISVSFTNASLYNAMRAAYLNPGTIAFSPTSGFHHAQPRSGRGYCTFSGQVIASVKLYQEFGISGAYLDLDGHFGNSIEDSRTFNKKLDKAVPTGFNINPAGQHEHYLESLEKHLCELEKAILNDRIHYVVWCHGADSHESDDLGGSLSTTEWLECSDKFYQWINQISTKLGNPLPVTLSLFGGYRSDHYESVLSLHTSDLVSCLNILGGNSIEYKPNVLPKKTKSFHF